MLIVQKLISNFFLSPMLMIVILMFLALFVKRLTNRFVKTWLIIVCIFTYFLAIEPVKDMFVQNLEKKYTPVTVADLKKGDFYVLLGGGIYDKAPSSLGRRGIPSEIAMGRLVELVRLYRVEPKKIVVSGGIVISGEVSESEIYKNYLIDLGVKAEDIITEGNSKTTAENAKFTSELAKKMNYKKVIVVTSATHMNRAKKSFEKLGLEVIPAPGAYISDYEKYDITSWMPKVSNIEMIYRALWEYVGVVYYKLRGV
ncbi:MAG: YdcF family protein [Acetoanaerobium sp.]|nr:YdcF family protein [Acetoanaerobium sp.]